MNHDWAISPTFRAAMTAILLLSCAWAASDANADDNAQASASADADANAAAKPLHSRAGEIGRATRTWLELQRTNAAAAPALPMPGAQATLAYQRYMNSFTCKIPESFGSTLSGTGGASRFDYTNAGSGATPPAGAN